MGDERTVLELVDRVVTAARIPGRTARADLRRELLTHFEDAGTSPDALRAAIDQFGPEVAGESLRRVYWLDYACAYLLKIAVSLVACAGTALLVQGFGSVRFATDLRAWTLAPRFAGAAGVSVAVVAGLVLVWEAGRPRFQHRRVAMAVAALACAAVAAGSLGAAGNAGLTMAAVLLAFGAICSTFELSPARLGLLFGAFALALYVNHRKLNVPFGPARVIWGSALLVVVWSAAIAILAWIDRVFTRHFAIV